MSVKRLDGSTFLQNGILGLIQLLVLVGCTSQTETMDLGKEELMVEKFDIAQYEKRLLEDSQSVDFIDADNNHVQRFGDRESGFVERVTPRGGYFTAYKKYFSSGSLNESGALYAYGQFKKGLWQEYSEDGEIVETINHDEKYEFSFEKIVEFSESNGIELRARGTQLSRELDDDGNPFWYLSWSSGETVGVEYIIKNIELNGRTGEVVELEDSRWEDN